MIGIVLDDRDSTEVEGKEEKGNEMSKSDKIILAFLVCVGLALAVVGVSNIVIFLGGENDEKGVQVKLPVIEGTTSGEKTMLCGPEREEGLLLSKKEEKIMKEKKSGMEVVMLL